MRLDKVLADRGLGTRSEIKKILRQGQVTLHGQAVLKADLQINTDDLPYICYRGEKIDFYAKTVFLLNKPAGVLSMPEAEGVPCALDYLPPAYRSRKFSCVGRLDKYSEGLLLITNDGELIHRLTQPKWKIRKLYYVDFEPEMSSTAAQLVQAAFARGINLGDFVTLAAEFHPLNSTSAEITVQEGKFHQVRRMLSACGYTVKRLLRLKEGPLALQDMAVGAVRQLNEAEIASLYAEVQLTRTD